MASTHSSTRTDDHGAAVTARATDLTKVYGQGETRVVALGSVSAELRKGASTAISAPSRSSKSTPMHCMTGLDTVSSGSARIGDTELSTLKDTQLTQLRRDEVGFIFQVFNLLPTLTAAENITLPTDIAGHRPDQKWLANHRLGRGGGHRPGAPGLPRGHAVESDGSLRGPGSLGRRHGGGVARSSGGQTGRS